MLISHQRNSAAEVQAITCHVTNVGIGAFVSVWYILASLLTLSGGIVIHRACWLVSLFVNIQQLAQSRLSQYNYSVTLAQWRQGIGGTGGRASVHQLTTCWATAHAVLPVL